MPSPATKVPKPQATDDPISTTTSQMNDLHISPKRKTTPRKLRQKDPVSTASQPFTPSPAPKKSPKPKPASKTSTPAGKDDQSQPSSALGKVSGLTGKAKNLAGPLKDTVQSTAEKGKDVAGGALPVPDLSVLKGLEVGEGGEVLGQDGNPLGRVTEGDPEDLVGQVIGEKGEILDEEGDLIGRVEALPSEAADNVPGGPVKDTVQGGIQKGQETVQNAAPIDLSVLKGLEVGDGGQVLGQNGNPLGRVVEGDPEDLIGQVVGQDGEILDEDGDVIGRVEALPDTATEKLPGGPVKDTVQESVQKGQEAVQGAAPIDISALKGLEVGEGGQILGQAGNPIGRVVEGDREDLVGLPVGDGGEILDEEGDLIGRVETLSQDIAEKAQDVPEQAQKAANQVQDIATSLADLEGLPVSEGGEIRDQARNIVARITEGDPEDLVGYTLNKEGEVVDDDGDAIGRAELVPQAVNGVNGEAEDDAAGEQDTTSQEQVKDASPFEKAKNAFSMVDRTAKAAKDFDPRGRADSAIAMVDRTAEGAKDAASSGADKAKSTVNEAAGDVKDAAPDPGDIKDTAEGVVDEAQEAAGELPPLSTLEGLKCNKMGNIVDSATGKPIGELIKGDPKKIARLGAQLDNKGQFWDNRGNVIGVVQTIPVEDNEEEAPFAGLEGLCVVEDGFVEDDNENRVGRLVEGDAKKLIGRAVDEDGDVLDKFGNVLAKAERWEEPEEPEPEPLDLSILDGLTPNKLGFVIGPEGVPVARVVEGKPKELAGKKIEDGQIWDGRKAIGRVELIPHEERESKPEGPFAGLDNIVVTKEGFVQDDDGNVVGKVIEGNPKKLRGRVVDEDGDIIDKFGNAVGHAERYEPPSEEEEPKEDLSILEGKIVNKAGNVVDEQGTVYGRIVAGDKRLAGRKVDGQGQIWSDDGRVIGTAQLIPGAEQQKPEGPFYGFDNAEVGKDGVVSDAGRIIGRVIEGDAKRLLGRKVDEDGEVLDKRGNIIGRAERWEPEEKKRNINPMAGRKVTREGEVRDVDGNLIGKLTSGNLGTLIGKEIDDNGYVVDNDGNKLGECTLLENIPPEPEPELSPEELEAQKKAEEDKKIAVKISTIVSQALDRLQPICKMITEVSGP